MADTRDFGIKTSPRLLGISAAGLTLVFAARQANISQVDLDFSILAFSLAAIAAMLALLIEIYLTDLERRRWHSFEAGYPGSGAWDHFDVREPWPDRPQSGLIPLLMLAMAMALLSLFGPLGWWRLLPLAIAAGIAILVYLRSDEHHHGILRALFAAACLLSLTGFVCGALYPVIAWGRQSGENIAKAVPVPAPTSEPTQSVSQPPSSTKIEIDLLLGEYAKAIRDGNARRIDELRRKISAVIEIRLVQQCPAALKGERGEKGDRGDKGDRGERGEPGLPVVCGS